MSTTAHRSVASLIQECDPPPKRIGFCPEGQKEMHLTEAAVMLSFALHLFETSPNAKLVRICPDGEHAKRFNISGWLEESGFRKTEKYGSTAYGGKYVRADQTIFVTPTSGIGDVVLEIDGEHLLAECKGGIVNTRHAGQVSKLRKGLCEAVGLLMGTSQNGRQVAVVAYTTVTHNLAKKMLPRTQPVGIEIALVHQTGRIEYVLNAK